MRKQSCNRPENLVDWFNVKYLAIIMNFVLATILQVHCAYIFTESQYLYYGVLAYKNIRTGVVESAYFDQTTTDKKSELICERLYKNLEAKSTVKLFLTPEHRHLQSVENISLRK